MQTDVTRNLVFATLTKVDEAKRLVYGRAVQEFPDRVGEIFDYESSKPLFQKWSGSQSEASMGKSEGNIRVMHTEKVAGKIPPGGLVFVDDEGAIDICAKITDDAEFEKCLDGTYTGFSIGGKYAKKWEDTELKKTRYTASPSEISLVDRPCVPTATFFDVQKADGSILRKDFRKPVDMTKVVRNDGAEIALEFETSKVPTVGQEFEALGSSFQVTKVEDGKVFVDEVFNIVGTAAELGAFAKAAAVKALTIADVTALVDAAPAKSAQMDPDAISKKADELIKAASGDPAEVRKDSAKFAQFTAAAEKELRKSVAKGANFADEKNKKYPLDSDAHVRAALSYWGMAKNRAKYSEEEQQTITGKIHAAAKDKGIDVASKVMTSAQIRKGMLECAQLATLIDSLCDICETVEMETGAEGDDSPICAKLYNCVDDLGSVLQEMVAEEIAEEVEGGAAAHQPSLAMAEKLGGLRKRLDLISGITEQLVTDTATELAKAAGKTDAAEFLDPARAQLRKKLAKAQSIHDRMVKMGASCRKDDDGGGDDVESADKTGDLSKQLRTKAEAMLKSAGVNYPTEDQLEKAIESLKPTDALSKVVAENATLKKDLSAARNTLTEMDARLKKVENMPLTPRIHIRAVGKGEDAGNAGGSMDLANKLVSEVTPVRKSDGTIDEVATATKMVLHMGGTSLLQKK